MLKVTYEIEFTDEGVEISLASDGEIIGGIGADNFDGLLMAGGQFLGACIKSSLGAYSSGAMSGAIHAIEDPEATKAKVLGGVEQGMLEVGPELLAKLAPSEPSLLEKLEAVEVPTGEPVSQEKSGLLIQTA